MSPDLSAIDVDYAELVGEELQSCCMPNIKDLSSATVDDIVRDLHRVLTGNGNSTHGIIFKVANTNVNIRLLKRDMFKLGTALNTQTADCKDFRAKIEVANAVGTAEKASISKITKFLWDNKAVVISAIIVVAMYINLVFNGESTTDLEERVEKAVNSKVDELFIGQPVSAIPIKVK